MEQEDTRQNQLMVSTVQWIEEKLIQESKDPQFAEQNLIQDVVPRSLPEAKKLNNKVIVMAALKQSSNPYARHSTNIESFKQLQERGLLLYRETQFVRVSDSLAAEEVQDSQANSTEFKDCRAVMALCSLHIKERVVTIEVFLYRQSKFCVTSSIDVEQLFLGNPLELSHTMRNKFIRQIMERLFVLEVQGRFEMKIEQDAEAMSDLIASYVEKYGGLPGQEDAHAQKIA